MFIDIEKACDSLPRNIIWDDLEAKGILRTYNDAIQDMYL